MQYVHILKKRDRIFKKREIKMSRKLVTVKKVTEIRPIPDADAIECAIIGGGWPVVVKKGEFKVGESGVFFEVDSFLPGDDERYAFLAKNKITWTGKEGVRLRTMKLRGQLSQGLILPLSQFPEVQDVLRHSFADIHEMDFAELLRVEKWEPVIPAALQGQIKGPFPSWIPKTDQERIQNLIVEVLETPENRDAKYEISVKLDGSSTTCYLRDGETGVCSRNLELKINEENAHNSFVKNFIDSGLQAALIKIGKNIAVQGELMGPGIQGNREQLKMFKMFVFDIFDIDNGKYLTPAERIDMFSQLVAAGFTGAHVPVLVQNVLPGQTLDELLNFAEGPSLNHQIREGLVYKRVDGKFSFKTISNRFLLKEK